MGATVYISIRYPDKVDALYTLDAKQKSLLAVLAALGEGWHTRQEMADYLKKKRLNPSEVTILETFVAQGQVEKQTVPSELPHLTRSIYRLKEEST